jgi:hypothetical protein
MKKNYTVSLDQEYVEVVRPFLEKTGNSLSGFLNEAIIEYAETLKGLDLPDDLEKMPLGVFMRKFTRIVKGMKAKK